jgi:hypothetical protein
MPTSRVAADNQFVIVGDFKAANGKIEPKAWAYPRKMLIAV